MLSPQQIPRMCKIVLGNKAFLIILHIGQLYGANNTEDHMTQAIPRV